MQGHRVGRPRPGGQDCGALDGPGHLKHGGWSIARPGRPVRPNHRHGCVCQRQISITRPTYNAADSGHHQPPRWGLDLRQGNRQL